MKITLSTWGRFHFFHLARQMEKRGWLERIYTTYPRFKLRDEKIPDAKIFTDPILETLMLAKGRYGLRHASLDWKLAHLKVALHDQFLERHVEPSDIFIALSGSGRTAGPKNQASGGKYICDRGSSHIGFANDCLSEEYKRWGYHFHPIPRWCIEREEEEYEIADRIVVPSSFVARTFTERGVDPARIELNGYGADLSRFRKTTEPPKDQFVVLFVGGVNLRKGIPYLLEAFKAFKHPKKTLRIVGGIAPEMQKFLKTAPQDNVEWLGLVPNAKLPDLMSAAHVMVLPSIEEGMALVQAEALACGCPVIASENTGGEDLFDHGREGFIVPIRNPRAITRRLEELADNPDLRNAMSQAAEARIIGFGGWDAYGDRYEKICRNLVRS